MAATISTLDSYGTRPVRGPSPGEAAASEPSHEAVSSPSRSARGRPSVVRSQRDLRADSDDFEYPDRVFLARSSDLEDSVPELGPIPRRDIEFLLPSESGVTSPTVDDGYQDTAQAALTERLQQMNQGNRAALRRLRTDSATRSPAPLRAPAVSPDRQHMLSHANGRPIEPRRTVRSPLIDPSIWLANQAEFMPANEPVLAVDGQQDPRDRPEGGAEWGPGDSTATTLVDGDAERTERTPRALLSLPASGPVLSSNSSEDSNFFPFAGAATGQAIRDYAEAPPSQLGQSVIANLPAEAQELLRTENWPLSAQQIAAVDQAVERARSSGNSRRASQDNEEATKDDEADTGKDS